MHKKINIVIWSIVFVLVILLIGILLFSSKVKLYEKTYRYFDTDITVRIYEDEPEKVERAWKKIQAIYEQYHQLANAHKAYDHTVNVHTIRYNQEESETLTLPSKLYQMLEYSNNWVQKSDSAFQITQGTVIDGWERYLETEKKVPSQETIDAWKKEDETSLVLLGNNQIKNTHAMIDLGKIPLGFANDEVVKYLEKVGITQYLIQEGGNASVGLSLDNEAYKVALEIPNQNDVATIIHLKNKAIVTNVSDIDRYEYDGKTYHLFIDPNTSYPANHIDKVSVIAPDSKTAYTLSTVLYMMDVEQGKKMVEDLQGVAVLWLDTDGKLSATNGFSQYES